jgi:hypothetical protein
MSATERLNITQAAYASAQENHQKTFAKQAEMQSSLSKVQAGLETLDPQSVQLVRLFFTLPTPGPMSDFLPSG